MSTLPMPAMPAATPAGAGPDAPAGETTTPRDPAFAAALDSALGSGARRSATPATSRIGDRSDAASPTDSASGADAEHEPLPTHDLVYHLHTAAHAAPPPAPRTDADVHEEGVVADAEGMVADAEAAPAAARPAARESGTTRSSPSSPPSPSSPSYPSAPSSHSAGAPHATHAAASHASHDRVPAAPATRGAGTAAAMDADAANSLSRAAATATATAPASARAARSPASAQRDAALLVPEFRTRLDRVVERLEAMGHTVQVVETYRDQARQDHLYAQGRTRPGSIVTWTRHSQHSHGRAADLLIDGSFEPSVGYVRLAQVAAEEGLRTLGPRDPGHVELPGGPRDGGHAHSHAAHAANPTAPRGGIAMTAAVAGPASIAQPAAVAHVATPAGVAGVAAVAGVARIASPGAAVRSAPSSQAGEVAGERRPAVETGPALAGAGGSRGPALSTKVGAPVVSARVQARDDTEVASAADADGVTAEPPRGHVAEGASPPRAGEESALHAGTVQSESGMGAAQAVGRSHAAPRTADAEIAGRVARVLQLQADAAAQPLTRVSLRLGEDGIDAGRIRIDLRGGAVETAIDLADPARAAELRGRIHELEAALQQRGLEATRLSVRHAAAAAATTTAAGRPAGAETAPAVPSLESLVAQQSTRSSDRQPEGGRQGANTEQRRSRGDQHRQEAK